MFLRPNGKVIYYICHDTKVSTFMANFQTLHIGYSVTGFKEKILMFNVVKWKLVFYLLMHVWCYQREHKHIHIFKQTIAMFKEVINIS